METDKLSNHNTNSNSTFQYSSIKPSLDGYGFDKERVVGAVNRKKVNPVSAVNYLNNTNDRSNSNHETTELTKLRPRGATSNFPSYSAEAYSALPPNVVFLEREILPSDTLQSFALFYGCTVNDLKRANNLINELDFFALRRIKIPVKKYGLLTEPEEELKRRPVATTSLMSTSISVSSTEDEPHVSNDVYHVLTDDPLSNNDLEVTQLLSAKPSTSKESTIEHNDTGKFLKSVDKEIRKTLKNSDKIGLEKNEVLEEVVSSLGSVGYRPLPLPSSKGKDCDGSSWGVKWSTLLVCFVLCLILVLIFVGIRLYSDSSKQSDPTAKPNGS